MAVQEVKLWKDAKDRRKYEDLADLFAIIKVRPSAIPYSMSCRADVHTGLRPVHQTTEHLETAYVRDAITPDEVSGPQALGPLSASV
jgi:ESCRT-I complex subunit VPS28